MKAIKVTYHGPTICKGSRLIADDGDGNRVTIGYPYHLDANAKYRAAADALCAKMGWDGEMVCASWKNDRFFVFINGWDKAVRA